MKKYLYSVVFSAIVLFSASVTVAAPVYWTDWTNITSTAPGVLGAITVGSDTIGVAFAGGYSSAQTSGGTNFWNPSTPYISSYVDNAPPASDIIKLNTGGTATITFSEAVLNPLIALVSFNGNTVDFGVPIEILSYGYGYWGGGTPILNADGDGFYGSGEVHGVIRLPGLYSSIVFTHTSENWHGITVGVSGLPTVGVPEPATMLLLGLGMIGLAGIRRMLN